MNENKFTPRAEETLRLAQEAAQEMGHGYVGTEHLLLGLLREEVGMAHRVLTEFPEPVDVRQEARNAAAAEPERTEPGLVDGAEQERLQQQRQRNALQNQMKAAIESENFEEAARLRDELKKLA